MVSNDPVGEFRWIGRLLALGVRVSPPRLPRSRSVLEAVEREATRDAHVRRALEVSLCDAELTRQVKSRTLRRSCGTILDVR